MPAASNFGRVAALYARIRPGYPAQLFDDLVELTEIPEGGRILEIGAATGQATLPMAQRGFRITAIEPDEPLVVEARSRMSRKDVIEFHISTFEDWDLPGEPFDLVLAATSFHWVDPRVRYVKAAAALRPGGYLAIVHTHHVRGGTQAFFDEAQACYAAHMIGPSSNRSLLAAEDILPDTEGLLSSGCFAEPYVRRYAWQETYTADRYTDLLATYSDHIALREDARAALFRCIGSLIETRFDGAITKQYMTELVVARKDRTRTPATT